MVRNNLCFLLLSLMLSACGVQKTSMTSFDSRKSFSVQEPTTFADLPLLSLPKMKKGDEIKVECSFMARTNGNGRSDGFYYHLKEFGSNKLEAISPNDVIFQGASGWQSCALIVFFRTSENIAENEVQLAIEFDKRDVKGNGQIGNIVLSANKVKIQD